MAGIHVELDAGEGNRMATDKRMNTTQWAQACAADGEFLLAARHWTGGLRLRIGDEALELTIQDGAVDTTSSAPVRGWVVYSGTAAVWAEILAPVPSRFNNDLIANMSTLGGLRVAGDPLTVAQYYGAIMRAVELLRIGKRVEAARHNSIEGSFDAPIGRYVHLNLQGHDHRLYYEEAGEGIPVLLQHTAGCHGSQWRHLFECPEITRRFRLIAYDLPMHGKSLPPTTKDWWAEPYRLKGDFLRSVPVGLTRVLGLDRPVFMGCSVGGLLALDLAHKHADTFRAVISVEGALRIGGDLESLDMLHHPQVSNDYKARVMDGLMAPQSPLALRRETSFVYASGWPASFLGDLQYYIEEFDLRAVAQEIDTNRIAVHILSGEYDHSGRSELGQAAHAAIPGSTWRQMNGVGHFPMSENPEVFLAHLRPILETINS